MENLSRAGIFDLALVFGYTMGAFMLVSSLLSIRDKVRDPGIALIRFMGGLALVVSILAPYSTETFSIFPIKNVTRTWSLLAICGTVILSIGIGDFAVNRIAHLVDAILARACRSIAHNWVISKLITCVGTVAVVAVSVAVLLVTLSGAKPRETDPSPPVLLQTLKVELILEATFDLSGSPTALVFSGEYVGYIALGQGQILHFELPQNANGDLRTKVVARGIDNPRGLALLDDVLYVSDLGPLPCLEIRCKGSTIPGMSATEGEVKLIEESNGSIFAFDLLADGGLGNGRTILTDLPASSFQHGANGIAIGPDGLLYVSIGGVDRLYNHQGILDTIEGPNLEFFGTVLRFKPDGSGLEVFAEGLRNVYALTFDDQGLLWGVDNDGPYERGWRGEEVLQIKRGANYGYPSEGTFGPRDIRDDNAVWIMDAHGSSGIEWAGNLGLGPGLIIGSCSQIHHLAMHDYDTGRLVRNRTDSHVVATVPGCVTIVEPGPEQNLIVGTFDTNRLHTFKLAINQP